MYSHPVREKNILRNHGSGGQEEGRRGMGDEGKQCNSHGHLNREDIQSKREIEIIFKMSSILILLSTRSYGTYNNTDTTRVLNAHDQGSASASSTTPLLWRYTLIFQTPSLQDSRDVLSMVIGTFAASGATMT